MVSQQTKKSNVVALDATEVESQNHRMFGVGRDLCGLLLQLHKSRTLHV